MINCFVDDQQKRGNWNHHRSASRFNVYIPKTSFFQVHHLIASTWLPKNFELLFISKIFMKNHVQNYFMRENGFWIASSLFHLLQKSIKDENSPEVLKPLSNNFICAYFLFHLLTKMLMFIICLCCCCYCYYILPSETWKQILLP